MIFLDLLLTNCLYLSHEKELFVNERVREAQRLYTPRNTRSNEGGKDQAETKKD